MKKSILNKAIFGLSFILTIGLSNGCKKESGSNKAGKPNYHGGSNKPSPPSQGGSSKPLALQKQLKQLEQFLNKRSADGIRTNKQVIDESSEKWLDINVEDKLVGIFLDKVPGVTGTLDLTGFNDLAAIRLTGTYISEVKISKQSYIGLAFWYLDQGGDVSQLHTLTDEERIAQLKSIKPPSPGDMILKSHIYKKADGTFITIVLVD